MIESWVHALVVVRGSAGLSGATLSAKWAKMVLGHNLHHMAPFGILEAGFCMVFRPASFWFLVPGSHFWTPEPKFGAGIWKLGSGWPGDVLGGKVGVGKT